jgi:hypothetical protein
MAKREFMTRIITKYLITAVIVALAIVANMTMIWLYFENGSNDK